MPPKLKKKGATAKRKANNAAKEAAAVPEKPAAKSVAASEEVPAAAAAAAAAEKQPLPDAGQKRPLEPEVPTVDLQATLQRRQKLAEELQTVEKQIYDLETRYLENSHPLGNALKGYEGLLTQSQASTRRTLVRQEDRLFSNSSVSGAPH